MATTVPSIDNPNCLAWSEQDINLYNKLPFYLEKMAINYRKTWEVYAKLVGKMRWTPNMGSTMRGVRKEPSPHLRQFAFPNEICATPKKDLIGIREVTVDANVRRHKFESQVMNFCPSFRDFLTDHVDRTSKDINEKITRFNDVFIRGHIFHQSPFVWLPNKAPDGNGDAELTPAPMGNGNDAGTDGKSLAFLQANIPLIGNPGNLSLCTINLALTVMENDLRVPPYSGGGQPGDNSPPTDKYVLVGSTEAWNQFVFDPFLLANKSIDLNIITNGFRGSLWGRLVYKFDDLPLRIKVDAYTGVPSFPAPQTIELNPNAYNYGETVPNPDYVHAEYEVAFMFGDEGYKAIGIGAPPSEFANSGMPNGFGKMSWNGEIILTKNINVPCLDADGNTVVDTNKYGEYLQLISMLALGIVGQQKRNVLPIIFKRRRGC